MNLIAAVKQVAPHCLPLYLDSLDQNAALLDKIGITKSPLRATHWLAQGLHETGGGTIIRESGNYSAARLVEIFGPGRSSAAITPDEAATLAHNGPAIFDRTYGLGNPHLARQLGNTKIGDGWTYRGDCFFQTTGRGSFKTAGDRAGVSFEANPDLMATPKFAVVPAAYEWDADSLNTYADHDDGRMITRKINGGYNGYAERMAWKAKLYPLLKASTDPIEIWQVARPMASTTQVQDMLNLLGYSPKLKVDGRYGPATHDAIEWFQKIHGLTVDGIAGPATLGSMTMTLGAVNSLPAPLADAA